VVFALSGGQPAVVLKTKTNEEPGSPFEKSDYNSGNFVRNEHMIGKTITIFFFDAAALEGPNDSPGIFADRRAV
jgi:hypothetical protein